MEERVLPNYFRHKHISSFIRQLNMYRFSKVCKPTKERNAMYFKNDLFLRGNMYASPHSASSSPKSSAITSTPRTRPTRKILLNQRTTSALIITLRLILPSASIKLT